MEFEPNLINRFILIHTVKNWVVDRFRDEWKNIIITAFL